MDVSPHKDEYLELCAGYALGSLDGAERATIEAHLAEGCPACEVEINRLGRGVWAFAAATPRLLEPSSLRARVLDAARRESAPRAGRRAGGRAPIPFPGRRAARVFGWMAALAAVLIAAFAVTEWRAASRLKRELAASAEEISKLTRQVESERELSAAAMAPQTRVIDLKPTPAGSPQLHARVTYDPSTRRALVAVSDFATPAGKDYQLWAITKSGPSSLGLVRADHEGRAVIRLMNAGDPFTLAAFAVSLENEGGAPTSTVPAGPLVMVGKI
jgi:anti-sigma-K factor RskA